MTNFNFHCFFSYRRPRYIFLIERSDLIWSVEIWKIWSVENLYKKPANFSCTKTKNGTILVWNPTEKNRISLNKSSQISCQFCPHTENIFEDRWRKACYFPKKLPTKAKKMSKNILLPPLFRPLWTHSHFPRKSNTPLILHPSRWGTIRGHMNCQQSCKGSVWVSLCCLCSHNFWKKNVLVVLEAKKVNFFGGTVPCEIPHLPPNDILRGAYFNNKTKKHVGVYFKGGELKIKGWVVSCEVPRLQCVWQFYRFYWQ